MASWQKLESSLPQSRAFGSSAIYGNFLYVCGGAAEVVAPFSTYRNQILKARIAPDGSLGQWKVVAELADDRLSPCLFISETGVMYVVGGLTDDSPANLNLGHDILSGRLNAEGELVGSGLQVVSRMPTSVSGAGVAVHGNRIYVVAGGKNRVELDYLAGDGNFQVGEVVTGKTSGATGTVHSIVSDGGATGTIGVESVSGSFVDAELLHGNLGGRARVDGAPGADKLDYSGQTTNFVVSEIIVAFSGSGATATVVADVDAGATGTLTLSDRVGTFADGEDLRAFAGAATADGTTYQTLGFKTQTVDFQVGEVVTGGTSGAVGTIRAQSDAGATGTLELIQSTVAGAFVDSEVLTGSLGGAAEVDGVLSAIKLDYDGRTGTFDTGGAGLIATADGVNLATILADVDAGGGAGTLTLDAVTGAFADNVSLVGYSERRAGAVGSNYNDLDFDSQTGDFQVGEDVTGLTSGATMRAVSVDGSVMLADFGSGTFSNAETVVGSILGSATADGDSLPVLDTNSDILAATVDSDGGVGSWQVVGKLPGIVSTSGNNAIVVANGIMYVSGSGTLFWAKIGVAAIDQWNQMSMPVDVDGMAMLAVGDRLVVLGGVVSAADVGTVRCLQLGGDGAPTGNWYRTADMTFKLSSFGAAVKDDRIYVVGGKKTAAASADVLTARLLDGFVGGEKI